MSKVFTEENAMNDEEELSYICIIAAIVFILGLLLMCFMTQTCAAAEFTECHYFVIENWPEYNFTAWAIANMDGCEVVFAEAVEAAEGWVGE